MSFKKIILIPNIKVKMKTKNDSLKSKCRAILFLLMKACFLTYWGRPRDSGGHIFFPHMKTEDMWYNEYICPKKSRTGGHHTFSVRGLRIYKQFPLCIQKTGSFPEGMICVVFLGARRLAVPLWLRLKRLHFLCASQALLLHGSAQSWCTEPSPAAVSHWEYQWLETNFVHGPWLGHPLEWVKSWLSETALVPGGLSHIYFYQASQTFLFVVRDPAILKTQLINDWMLMMKETKGSGKFKLENSTSQMNGI